MAATLLGCASSLHDEEDVLPFQRVMRLHGAVDIALDRLGILFDQLESACDAFRAGLGDMTDDENLWEPVAGAWSIRPRGHAIGANAYGPGDFVLDAQIQAPDPPPVTTIAWRLGHVTSGIAGRWEWTFGTRSIPPEDLVDFSPHASAAIDGWWGWMERWQNGLRSLTAEQLDSVGFGQYPWGLDRQIPFVGIVWWTNQEVIHHMAEISLLRDLRRAGIRS
jgi:hypothetical protein